MQSNRLAQHSPLAKSRSRRLVRSTKDRYELLGQEPGRKPVPCDAHYRDMSGQFLQEFLGQFLGASRWLLGASQTKFRTPQSALRIRISDH